MAYCLNKANKAVFGRAFSACAPKAVGVNFRHFFKRVAVDAHLFLIAGVLAILCIMFVVREGLLSNTPEPHNVAGSADDALPQSLDWPIYISAPARDQLLSVQSAILLSSGTTGSQHHSYMPQPTLWNSGHKTFQRNLLDTRAREGLLVSADNAGNSKVLPTTEPDYEHHALAVGPAFDSLASVHLSGLPAGTRLSAGADLSRSEKKTSDWALALGDLDKLVLQLPRQKSYPIQTNLEVRNRAGVIVAALTVQVIEEPESNVRGKRKRSNKSMSKLVLRAKSEFSRKKSISKSGIGGPSGAAIMLQFPSSSAASGGLFQPDAKDSELSGLSPSDRIDPRFMTLNSLGSTR